MQHNFLDLKDVFTYDERGQFVEKIEFDAASSRRTSARRVGSSCKPRVIGLYSVNGRSH